MPRSDSGRLIRSKRHLHEQWNCREGPDRDKSDRRGLPRRAIEMFSHEQTDPEAKGGPGQGQQSIQRQCIRRFWNG